MTHQLPNNGFIVENEERNNATIVDPVTGRCTTVPLQHSRIMLNPQTGERVFTTAAALHLSRDGRIAKLEEGLYCRDCGSGPWTSHAIAYCTDCQNIIGRNCCTKDHAEPRCKRCRRKRFWQWLFSIGQRKNTPAPQQRKERSHHPPITRAKPKAEAARRTEGQATQPAQLREHNEHQ